MEHPSESVNFLNGFPGNFAKGLPTDEFNGALPAAPLAEERADNAGFVPNDFPDFQSIGGFSKMADEPDQSSNSFVPEFKPPQFPDISDIQDEQPKFEIPPHFSQQLFN